MGNNVAFDNINALTALSGITLDQLVELIAERTTEKVQAKTRKEIISAEYLTAKETEDYLTISAVTRNKWSKRGILKKYRIGGRVRYKSTELDEALKLMEAKRN